MSQFETKLVNELKRTALLHVFLKDAIYPGSNMQLAASLGQKHTLTTRDMVEAQFGKEGADIWEEMVALRKRFLKLADTRNLN